MKSKTAFQVMSKRQLENESGGIAPLVAYAIYVGGGIAIGVASNYIYDQLTNDDSKSCCCEK